MSTYIRNRTNNIFSKLQKKSTNNICILLLLEFNELYISISQYFRRHKIVNKSYKQTN